MNRRGDPLWPVVHRVRGRDTDARRRKVEQDDLVPCFIRAGVDQLMDCLAEPLVQELAKEHLAAKEPGFRIRSVLAAERIVARINSETSYQRKVTRQHLRERWTPHSRYVADVLSFATYRRHWSLRIPSEQEIQTLIEAPDLAAAIDQLAHLYLRAAATSDTRSLHILGTAFAHGDAIVSQAVSDTYQLIQRKWEAVYQRVLDGRGLRLRTCVTLSQFTIMLTGMDDGLTTRMHADPQAGMLSAGPKGNVLGLAAKLIVLGSIDTGATETVSQAVNRVAAEGASGT